MFDCFKAPIAVGITHCRVIVDAGPIIGTTSPMVIGYSGGSKYFKGYIDNVSIRKYKIR